jgi:Tol biopolymer transport system component
MALVLGQKLGSYEILSLLGKGGMGEVYRARDTKLKRDVAIKILPDEFSRDPERVSRFQREAEALAALNHRNIAAIYDVQEANNTRFLIIELVEGDTLADCIKRGPLPIKEALDIAKQISEALEAAHEKGIVHRDLKPANIKLTPEGSVKLLDFGLARVFEDNPAAADPSNSPTLMSRSSPGVILGTAAYMSPEQARGKTVDKHADIWAFGVVVYEMLTGGPLFKGEDVSEILAAVIKEEPKWDRVPVTAQRMLRKCLEKDPKQRLRDIADAWALLDAAPAAQPVSRRRSWLGWGVAALLFVVLLVSVPLALVHFREKPSVAEPVRFQIPMPEKVTLGAGAFALSPDGHQLVFAPAGSDGVTRLWVRSLDSLEARQLPGTEGAGQFPPFWSSDSRFVGFAAGGKYMKVPVSGGPAQTLCELPGTLGASAWNRDGVILMGANPGGLWRVPESGGVPSPVTTVDPSRQEQYHGKPAFLPDGRHFLYYRVSSNAEYAGTYIGSLELKPEHQDGKRLLPGPLGAQYVPSSDPGVGYVLFLREATLMAQPFDTRRLELTGEAVPIAEQVGNNSVITGFFSASENGMLAYRGGGGGGRQLRWLDRQGKELSRAGDPATYSDIALSPDATRVAIFRAESPFDIWLFEFVRGVSTRFTFTPAVERFPVWSPDGMRIAFASNRGSRWYDLYQKVANGAGEDELLFKSDQNKTPTSWSRDGRFLFYHSTDPKTKVDLWALPLDGDRKPISVLRTEFNEGLGSFSPDTRWIAYLSDESGRVEVYVRPFSSSAAGSPPVTGKWQVSKGAGQALPFWRADGKELYYLAADRKMMAVELTTSPTFKAGVPQALFDAPPPPFGQDMTADGKRFLFVTPVVGDAQAPITIVLNWTAALKK